MGIESARRLRKTARKSRRNQKGGNDGFVPTEEQNEELDRIYNEAYEKRLKEYVESVCLMEGHQAAVDLCKKKEAPLRAQKYATTARNEALENMKNNAKTEEEVVEGGKRRRRRRGRKTARKSRRKGRKSGRKSRRRSRR